MALHPITFMVSMIHLYGSVTTWNLRNLKKKKKRFKKKPCNEQFAGARHWMTQEKLTLGGGEESFSVVTRAIFDFLGNVSFCMLHSLANRQPDV